MEGEFSRESRCNRLILQRGPERPIADDVDVPAAKIHLAQRRDDLTHRFAGHQPPDDQDAPLLDRRDKTL